jgi:hypothetical protein
MTPIVTTPPIVFNAVAPARMDDSGSIYCGPFQIGMAQYVVLISQPVNPPAYHRWLNVYKSTDNGTTWTSMDAANRPQTNGNADAILNGTVFTICYGSNTVANPLKVITFNTATDTFGAPSVDGPLTNGVARLGQFASGDLCIWFGGFTLGIQRVVIFSGGAWGVPVDIPNNKNAVCSIVMGVNNIAQLFYYDLNAPGLNVFYRTFTNGGVLGAEDNVVSSTVPNVSLGLPFGKVIIQNGNFILPCYGGPNNNQAGIWTGAPYTAPVWTFTIVNSVAQGPQPAGDTDAFAFLDSSNNLILFWITLNSVPSIAINQISYSINSGTGFAPQVLFADETAYPQTVDPSAVGNVLHTLSAVRYADGGFGVVTAIDLTIPTPPPCAGFFLAGAPAPCPKNAQGV